MDVSEKTLHIGMLGNIEKKKEKKKRSPRTSHKFIGKLMKFSLYLYFVLEYILVSTKDENDGCRGLVL